MPAPTILIKASTRVVERSIIVLPPGTSRVDDGCYAVGQRVLVGEEPAFIATVGVHVDIDQARGHHEAAHIYILARSARELGADGGDSSILNRQIANAIEIVFRVNEMAAA